MNEISIIVSSQDKSGPGFASAAANQKKVADATRATGQAYEQAQTKAQGLGASLKRVGEVAAGVLVADTLQAGARRVIAFAQQSANAAKDLGESVNAVNKVFGDSSAQIQAWAQSSANSYGLSQRAFNQAATPLGSMLKNQGLAMNEVTEHTIKLTKRASDLASVFNTDVSDALVAIQAGLRGEQDPLERYGVSLSAVAVEARALADSHKTSAAQLTNQEKALARLNIIYDQTADSEGDFIDTSDQLANATRRAAAATEEAQAKLGKAFLPAMTKAKQITAEFAKGFVDLPQPILLGAAAVAGLGAATALLAPRFLATKDALDRMIDSDSRMQRSMGRTAVVVGKATAALAAAQVVGGILASVLHDDLNPQVDALNAGMAEWAKTGQIGGETARIFGEDVDELDRALSAAAATGFSKWTNGISEFVLSLVGADSVFEDSRARVQAFDNGLAELVRNGNAELAGRLIEQMAGRAEISVETAIQLLPAYAAALETATKGTANLGTASGTTAERIAGLHSEVDKFIGKTLGLEEAEDNAADAMARLSAQVKQQKKDHEAGAGALTGNTQAARDNRDQVRGLVEDYLGLVDQYRAAGKSTEGLARSLEDQLVAMGFNRAEVARYTEQLKALAQAIAAIPPAKTVTIKVRATGGAAYRVEGATGDLLGGMASGGIVGAGSNWPGMAVASAATGGARGGWTMVGEHGPELARLPYGSTVIPNGTTRNMLAGPGGVGFAAGGAVLSAQPFVYGGSSRYEAALIEDIRTAVAARGGTLAVLGLRS